MVSLEKHEHDGDEEANHSGKHRPNEKTPEMHPVVLVSSHNT